MEQGQKPSCSKQLLNIHMPYVKYTKVTHHINSSLHFSKGLPSIYCGCIRKRLGLHNGWWSQCTTGIQVSASQPFKKISEEKVCRSQSRDRPRGQRPTICEETKTLNPSGRRQHASPDLNILCILTVSIPRIFQRCPLIDIPSLYPSGQVTVVHWFVSASHTRGGGNHGIEIVAIGLKWTHVGPIQRFGWKH